MNKKSFIIYMNYEDKLAPLTDEEVGKILRATFYYLRTNSIPKNLSEKLKYVFNFIKVDLDDNNKKYQAKVDRLRENAKSSKSKRKAANRNENKQTESVNDNTIYIDINNNNKDLEDRGMGKETFTNDDLEIIKDEWNEVAKNDLSKITVLSKTRKDKLKLRLKEYGKDLIIDAIKKIPKSKFLLGDNKQGWKCSFDWLIENDKNILKVYEGNYESKEKKKTLKDISFKDLE